jgi:hypothetical protein
MNGLDWIALLLGLAALLEFSWDGIDGARGLNRSTPAQMQTPRHAEAGLLVGGEVLMRFTDTGVMAAEERAREARMNLRRAVETYGLPTTYLGAALRSGGLGDVAEVAYLDMRITTVSASDATAGGATSVQALAAQWREALDKAIRALPTPVPDGWIVAATGGGGGGAGRIGRVMVSDETLTTAAAASLNHSRGQRVTATAADGIIRLDGSVAEPADKGRLVRLMRELPGVRGVDDRLSVSP